MNKKRHPMWLAVPGLLIYITIFVIPTFASFYFSMTTWNLKSSVFTGFENFISFFTMTSTRSALINTAIYATVTCSAKVILGLLIAQYVCSGIRTGNYLKIVVFFPTLLGNVVIGTAFQSVLDPGGIVNQALTGAGLPVVRFLTDKTIALATCCAIDIWKGLGTAVIIFVAGLSAIPRDYYEASAIDGATGRKNFTRITLPLIIPTINTVLTLSLIGGLRDYDLIYTLTGGGPGYSTEVIGSVVYKLFSRGSYGLATAGNVILFVIVSIIVFPLNSFVSKWEERL